MEKSFLKWFIENRRVTLFFILALAIFGIYNYWLMPKQENPQISPPVAKVSAIYPGASPAEIEEAVTRKIEDELVGIGGLDFLDSYSHNSSSTVIIWLQNDTDVEKAWTDLRQKMEDLQSKLPDACQKIEVDTDLDNTAGFILSFSGENYTSEELAFYAEKVKNEVENVKGISKVEVQGEQERQVKVKVNTARLNQLALSLDDIVSVFKAQNIEIPSGDLNDGDMGIVVNTPGKLRNIEEINNLVIGISPENGNVLQLKEVAEVFLETEDATVKYQYNGEESVFLTGYFLENRNVLIIGDELEKKIADVKKLLPKDLNIGEVLNQPADIRNSVNNLMINLLEGILFVILVVFLGMGLRNALVVATAIPLSILLAFSVMNLFGLQVHQISIAGLIIALGMLVDNAIVISDSIQVRLDNKEDRLLACVRGVKDVAIPVLTATLTTLAAYVPLLLLKGTAGEYVRSIPQIVIISLSASYLVALFFTPTIAFLFFKEGSQSSRGNLVWNFFRQLSDWGMNRKWLVILLGTGALAFSLFLASDLSLVFFPKADKDVVYLDIHSEQTGNLDKTEELTNQVEQILKQQKEIVGMATAIGEGMPKFFVTLASPIKSLSTAQIMISLDLDRGGRFKNNTQLVEYLQGIFDQSVTGGTVTAKEMEQAEPVPAPIIVRLTGDDQGKLEQASAQIKNLLKKTPGTININDDVQDKNYQYQVDIDSDLASQLGLTRYDIQKEINIDLKGKVSSILRTTSGKEYEILVVSDIENIKDLENLTIKSSASGQKVILKQVAQVKLEPQLPLIKRYNRQNTVNVFSDVKLGKSAVDIQNTIQEKIKELDFEGVTVSFDGEKDKINKYFGDLGIAALFAFLAIYIIMLIQFKSLVQPLIILIAIPLSVIGSIIGLLIFRQPLSFTALLGVVSLIGVVINNAIILLDYINWERDQGKDIDEACRHAVEKRVRPILLTTGTTVLGLVPLIFSGTLFVPMAVTLMSGLLVSTLLTIVVIPVVYSLVMVK